MSKIKDEVNQLKKENDAVILAHYYVPDDVQEIADYVGDSYFLSETATKVNEKKIILCGVSFMAESAKILNPDKVVISPDTDADCPMAHMADLDKILEVKEQFNDVAVVCYVNSSAELKAHSDVCVTSSNALKIVKSLPNKYILFIPDENLGRFIASKCPEKEFIFNEGHCYVHSEVTPEMLETAKKEHPNAKVLVHPESRLEISEMADYAGSTSGIIEMAGKYEEDELIIGTEIGVLYELRKRYPHKTFHSAGKIQMCSDMKKVTLEKVLDVLRNEKNIIELPEKLMREAKAPLDRMIELTQTDK